jgi:3-oxosteroid 1-dehydrogenase
MARDLDCDVVLVGAGVGSMAAALVLKRNGLRPLIVEKTEMVGGATAYSGGIVWAPDNFRMRAKGIVDSPEQAMTYLEAIAGGRGDPAIARAYLASIPRVVEELQAHTAVRWVTYPGLPDYHTEVAGGAAAGRYLLPHGDLVRTALEAAAVSHPEMRLVRPAVHLADRRHEWVWGRALAGCLWAKCLDEQIPFLLNHRATSLTSIKGRVTGVELDSGGADRFVSSRRGVLLDTGGFEWNAEMDRRFVPGPRFNPQTPPSNEGDGHLMAARVGAAFALMDQTIGMPSIRIPGELNDGRQLHRILFQELALPHSILVNAGGRRFANETYFVDVARSWQTTATNCRFTNLPCFFIFDADYLGRYGPPGGVETDHLQTGETIEALAKASGIHADGLVETVGEFNEAIRGGRLDAHGRGSTAYQRAFGDPDKTDNPTLGFVARPPFFAIEIHPATSGHRGGVVIDAKARVLDWDGQAIPGLFACGAVAAGTLTGGLYFTGTAVGHALVFGTIAAECIDGRA